MKNNRLKIGRIPYANLFPIYYYLDHGDNQPDYTFVTGVPSKLNKMLRQGELDVSPSSSIEFLKNKDRYRILPWHSISSTGTIKSILLFSSIPIEELGGKTLAVTSDSATATVMLKIILKNFYSLRCRFKNTNLRSVHNILSSHPAVLHIGDTAMIEARKLSAVRGRQAAPFVYDLGELWHRFTGHPFVFALWVVRKKSLSEKTDLIRKLSFDIIRAKKLARKEFTRIAKKAPQKKWISEKELVQYWNIISYDFTEKHLQGLRLFEEYATED